MLSSGEHVLDHRLEGPERAFYEIRPAAWPAAAARDSSPRSFLANSSWVRTASAHVMALVPVDTFHLSAVQKMSLGGTALVRCGAPVGQVRCEPRRCRCAADGRAQLDRRSDAGPGNLPEDRPHAHECCGFLVHTRAGPILLDMHAAAGLGTAAAAAGAAPPPLLPLSDR